VFELGEYECGFDDGADLAGAGGEVVECAPAAGEDGEAAFAQAANGDRRGQYRRDWPSESGRADHARYRSAPWAPELDPSTRRRGITAADYKGAHGIGGIDTERKLGPGRTPDPLDEIEGYNPPARRLIAGNKTPVSHCRGEHPPRNPDRGCRVRVSRSACFCRCRIRLGAERLASHVHGCGWTVCPAGGIFGPGPGEQRVGWPQKKDIAVPHSMRESSSKLCGSTRRIPGE
jgi:hypothetical protein